MNKDVCEVTCVNEEKSLSSKSCGSGVVIYGIK